MFVRCGARRELSPGNICGPTVFSGSSPPSSCANFRACPKLPCVTVIAGRGRGGSRTAPTTGTPGVLRCLPVRRTRLQAGHVGATRCVALVPSCTMVSRNATSVLRVRRTEGATRRVAPTLPAGGVQDRLNHACFRVVRGHGGAVPLGAACRMTNRSDTPCACPRQIEPCHGHCRGAVPAPCLHPLRLLRGRFPLSCNANVTPGGGCSASSDKSVLAGSS